MVKATAANVHDSQIITDIIPTDFKGSVYADAGYIGASQLKDLNDRGIETIVCEKGYRNHPLTEEQRKITALNQRLDAVLSMYLASLNKA